MLTFQEDGQACLFDQDICVGKMCPALSQAEKSKAKTSGLSSKKLSELSSIPFMSLDLSRDAGNLLGEYCWEIHSPYVGEHLILNTGPAPRNVENVSSLSQILEANPPRKYYLTKKACLGILRRSEERGKQLPPQLELALKLQAGLIPLDTVKIGGNNPTGVDGYNADLTGNAELDTDNLEALYTSLQPTLSSTKSFLAGGRMRILFPAPTIIILMFSAAAPRRRKKAWKLPVNSIPVFIQSMCPMLSSARTEKVVFVWIPEKSFSMPHWKARSWMCTKKKRRMRMQVPLCRCNAPVRAHNALCALISPRARKHP